MCVVDLVLLCLFTPDLNGVFSLSAQISLFIGMKLITVIKDLPDVGVCVCVHVRRAGSIS